MEIHSGGCFRFIRVSIGKSKKPNFFKKVGLPERDVGKVGLLKVGIAFQRCHLQRQRCHLNLTFLVSNKECSIKIQQKNLQSIIENLPSQIYQSHPCGKIEISDCRLLIDDC